MSFDNDSFETAAASGIPGEAESWTWTSVQSAAEWAEFNTATAHVAYQRAREGFEAGFVLPWIWDYADAAARLAAVGFTAADVGGVAVQRSDNTLWLLADDSPITWSQISVGWNQDWLSALVSTIIGAAEFSGAPDPLEIMFEQWNQCTEDYDSDTVPDYIDPPWRFTSDDLVTQGWEGWTGNPAYLVPEERFDEAWGSGVFDTVIATWYGGQAPSGVLRSAALSFPLTVGASQNLLQVYRDSTDAVVELAISPGTYASATALATEIQTLWSAASPGSLVEWTAWADGGETGIQLGWDGVSTGTDEVMLAIAEEHRSNDVRATIGLASFGPDGVAAESRYPAALLTATPPGTPADGIFAVDGWSQIIFTTDTEARFAYLHPIENGGIAALFDTGVGGLTASIVDTFRVWHGGDIVWKTAYVGGDLTSAAFVGGVGAGAVFESFEDPTTNWPDHIYTDV